jgi:CRP-like cAMP-binding protein
MDFDSLWSNIFRRSDDEDLHALLREIPMFEGLSSTALSKIEPLLHRREYQTDEVLFRQGNPGVGMFIIREGTIQIVYEPTQDVLAELHDGDFFGELALLNETPRSATAIATEPTVLFGLFQPDLLSLVERNPSLGVKILMRMARVISERLIQSNEQMQAMRERIATLKEQAPAAEPSEASKTSGAEEPVPRSPDANGAQRQTEVQEDAAAEQDAEARSVEGQEAE